MSFLYPLFLWSAVALAIPVLIHLFNLRKYKTVMFPHTRFLRNIQLHSRKQSQVRYKWLLATRLLFLLSLILAFAQPFFGNSGSAKKESTLRVIYVDNSNSMLVRKGARTLLDVAKETAIAQVRKSAPGSRFLILTNDKPESYYPVGAEKAAQLLAGVNNSSTSKTVGQVLSLLHSLGPEQLPGEVSLYYYSDFQQNAFPAYPDEAAMKHLLFYGVPLKGDEPSDIAIDTAYLTNPVLVAGKTNQVVLHAHVTGKPSVAQPVVRLVINGQVKSVAGLTFNSKNESTDTLSFSVNDSRWQSMILEAADGALAYDDTFRITARTAPNLSVLVVNEGRPNPFVQAAFRAYNGFRINQAGSVNDAWKDYNLVILDGVTHIDATLGNKINEALQAGQTICLFPGRTANISQLNEGLSKVADLKLSGPDTATQVVAGIQQGSDLVKELFEKIPENVQLPVANWHYVISAGISANQQAILSFRNGDPFLARYTPGRGNLYLCATAADLSAGNFPGSYFFTPFLYQMAMQSGSSSVYALTSGQHQPVYLPLPANMGRNVVHLYHDGADMVPPQRAAGAGVELYPDQVVQSPGFYTLVAGAGDTTLIALNGDKNEARLEYRDIAELKSQWKQQGVFWTDPAEVGKVADAGGGQGFPLWKLCVLSAVLMLFAETGLLARRQA